MTNIKIKTSIYKLEFNMGRLNPDLEGREVYLVNNSELTFPVDFSNGINEMTAPLDQWLQEPGLFPISQPVEFAGFFPTLLDTDWPYSKERYPLFRQRMIDALRSAGDFPHRLLKARITDDCQGEGGNPSYVIGQTTEDYKLLHITEHLDALDVNSSEYDEYWPEADLILGLVHPVLIPPIGGFPPIFRLKRNPNSLLISESGRAALLSNGIEGFWLKLFWEG